MDKIRERRFKPRFRATGVGSLPYPDASRACALILRTFPQTPFWPQLPKHSVLEKYDVQVSPGLPFLKVDELKGEVHFDPSLDEARELEKVYSSYLAGDIESYRLPPGYADGLEAMVQLLAGEKTNPPQFFKGQMVGPISFALSLQDAQGKSLIYNEMLFDAVTKGLLLRGRWMIEEMKKACEHVILFLDEPGLTGYGSAFFSVDEPTISKRLNEAIEEFQGQGARIGIHCCGNTDWSLLLKTRADIINFDAWGFLERFSLYPEAVQDFLSRGGVLAWGIIPTTEFTGRETVEELEEKLEAGFRSLARKGVSEEALRESCLLTPSCGLGLMPLRDAEKAMGLLAELSGKMQRKYFP
jgi:hypothetical protein